MSEALVLVFPAHDRFNAIVNTIKPEEFEPVLLQWITQLHAITKGQVVAIDGKSLRRSYDHATGKAATSYDECLGDSQSH